MDEHPLRRMREKHNLSIDALAGKCGVSSRTILRAEQKRSIYPSSRALICGFFSQVSGTTITAQQLGLIEDDTELENDMDRIRRELMKQAILLAGSAKLLTSIDVDRLAAALVKPSNMNEEALEHFAVLNEKCWVITNTSELATIDQILPTYLPQLATIARQTSKNQRAAAGLTAQGYLLAGLVALDQLDYANMDRYSQLAIEYSKASGDYNLQAAAFKQQATMYLIEKEPYKALRVYQQVLPFISQVSPLLRSRIYQGLANAAARCNQDVEAVRYLGLAYETFPADWEKDPSFLYADSGLSVLHMYDGLTQLDLNQPEKALEAFIKVDGLNPKIPIGETTQLEFINLQAKAALAMRNQDLTRQLIEAGVTKADMLNCRWGRTEAFEIYQDARLIWPNESQVKTLGQLFYK